jgi:FXSXX-COOH protein
MTETPDPRRDLETDTGIIDVTELSLRDLAHLDQSSLGLALRRVLDPDQGSTDPVIGFQSSL